MMIPRFFLAAVLFAAYVNAAPPLTTIQDMLYKADGTRFSGTLTISWESFQAADNSTIVKQSTTVKVSDGKLRVQLVPTTNSTPAIFYSVTYNSDGRVQFQEIWSVPSSGQPLLVSDVRVPSAPPSVVTPAPAVGTIEENDVIGLVSDLAARPLKGPGYSPNRVAMISSQGALESVLGADGDCVRVDGSTGPCGSVAPAFIDHEVPAGAVNGVNANFLLSATPLPASSLAIYRNGLLQKEGVDYNLAGRSLEFLPGALPQSGDILLATYRVAGSETGAPQPFPTAEVLCGGVGGSTGQTSLTSLGVCVIAPGVLSPGNRVEIRFNYEHTGNESGFSVDVAWGLTNVVHREAVSSETLVAGRADAGVFATGAQLSVQSWGTVLAFTAGGTTASDAYTNGLTIDLRGEISDSSSDTLTLRNFTVLRLP